MKLKIIFSEPPYVDTGTSHDEKIIEIKNPYKIIQEYTGDTRKYQTENGTILTEDSLTYEDYCTDMQKRIVEAVKRSRLSSELKYDDITLEGFHQPNHFKTICEALSSSPIVCADKTNITLKNCEFTGALHVNSIGKLTNKNPDSFFSITLDEKNKSKISAHYEAHLASLNNVAFFKDRNSEASLKNFIDDTLIGIKKTPLTSKLESPTYFYRQALQSNNPAGVLKSFFSEAKQQQNDYTCGPATVKMVADYYSSMEKRKFCGQPIEQQYTWKKIAQDPEMIIAAEVNTSEAEGSGIPEIRNGLYAKNLTVIDDDGISVETNTESELNAHKTVLWDKMRDILALDVPVILNMRDRDDVGHFEVAIGIEQDEIILAEPGTALAGALEFERLSKDKFCERWKNMSGKFHGRFMVLPPNASTTQKIEDILKDIPHCLNGEDINRNSTSRPAS